jgi:polyisoprenoid-binding protein YceI
MKKKTLFGSLLLSAFLIASFHPKSSTVHPADKKKVQKTDTYIVDIDKSKLYWTGKGVSKEHTGYVTIQSGSLLIDTKTITGGFFYINMKSITDTDIKDAGFKKNLEDHLKSQDFFFSAKFPTSTLKIIKTERLDVPAGQPNYKINGELTIKGIKKSVDFMTTIVYTKKTVHVSGTLSIDRTQWDIKYNSGNFFQDLGDKLIEDQIDFKIDVLADMK